MLTDVSDGKRIFKHILIECTIIRRKNEIKLSFPKIAFSLTDIIFAACVAAHFQARQQVRQRLTI